MVTAASSLFCTAMLALIPCARAATAAEQLLVVLEFNASLTGVRAVAALSMLGTAAGKRISDRTPVGA